MEEGFTAKTRRERGGRRKRRSGRGIHREDAKGRRKRRGGRGIHREDAKGAKEEKEWKRDSPLRREGREGGEGREGVEEGLHR